MAPRFHFGKKNRNVKDFPNSLQLLCHSRGQDTGCRPSGCWTAVEHRCGFLPFQRPGEVGVLVATSCGLGDTCIQVTCLEICMYIGQFFFSFACCCGRSTHHSHGQFNCKAHGSSLYGDQNKIQKKISRKLKKITESLNYRGWKGPLEIKSNLLLM